MQTALGRRVSCDLLCEGDKLPQHLVVIEAGAEAAAAREGCLFLCGMGGQLAGCLTDWHTVNGLFLQVCALGRENTPFPPRTQTHPCCSGCVLFRCGC